MIFLSPLALALLIPWAALTLWLLWARHRPTTVPFIDLWRGPVKLPRASRQFSPPPVSLVAILSAIALALLAAAGPTVPRGKFTPPVTLVLDRGITMSARGRLDEVRSLVKNLSFSRQIEIPEDSATSHQPTTIDTSAELQRTVANLLSHSSEPVVVLTDQPLRDDPRLVTLSPTKPVANVAITRFALRERPTTQAMITLHNDSSLTSARLSVDNVHQRIDLPAAGEERNYFLDLPTSPAKARATLDVPDDFDGDNTASLDGQQTNPAIEMRGSLAPQVRRVVEAYQSARPPSDGAPTIAVVASQDQLKDNQSGIISPLAATRIDTAPTAHIHPITQNLTPAHWTNLHSATPPIGDGWAPILSSDNKPLISIREHPARQVWIGFTSPDLPRTPDFVILWTNALDWLAQTAPGAGEFRTFDRPAPRFGFTSSNEPALAKLQALLKPRRAALGLAPYLSVAAIICASFAACLWPRRILTAFSPARTV